MAFPFPSTLSACSSCPFLSPRVTDSPLFSLLSLLIFPPFLHPLPDLSQLSPPGDTIELIFPLHSKVGPSRGKASLAIWVRSGRYHLYAQRAAFFFISNAPCDEDLKNDSFQSDRRARSVFLPAAPFLARTAWERRGWSFAGRGFGWDLEGEGSGREGGGIEG